MLGETIGNFKVVSRLGRGGMGEVFVGEHTGIQTRVAIKMLHAEISQNTDHVQRFFNEARIVGRIKHAGIVKIYDVGLYHDHAYLIMELLEGEPLAARIARAHRLGWQDTVELGRQIASVLDATHRAGVIHRDLKPDNIFLVADHELDRGERIKILDFGISKLSGTLVAGPKTVGTMGTPAYMAPEQWGDAASVDWRADAYSLGCALFEMACGRPPFEVSTIADACAKHLHAVPPRARQFAQVPDELDALIARLLAKRPADRAASMGQVVRELAGIGGASASVIGHSTIDGAAAELQTSARTVRTVPMIAAAAVAAVALVAIIAFATHGSKELASSPVPPAPAAPAVAASPPPAPVAPPALPAQPAPEPAVAPPTGPLSLVVTPACDVYVDGKNQHVRTPVRDLQLPEGRHRVMLVNSALGIRHGLDIVIEHGVDTTRTLDLTPKHGAKPPPPAPAPGPGSAADNGFGGRI